MRSNTLDAARRIFLAVTRGTIVKADDSPKMQTVSARLLHNEMLDPIERVQTYAHTSVPLPPTPDGKAAEVVVAFLNGGNRSHPVVIATDDRRFRLKNMQPGESAHHDDQGQYSKVARDGHHRVAKQHTLTAAGDGVQPGGATKPDSSFELNDQLKGIAARLAQAEHNLHGLFDVTSEFRQIVQQQIPQVAAVADRLNQDPSGLPIMADAIAGKEQAYLQQQVEQALQKFLSPNLAGLQSLLGGVLEQSIGALQGQIAGLVTNNPVVGIVDGLQSDIGALASSGGDPAVVAARTADLTAQVAALTSANPIVSSVAGLRSTLDGLIAQAGPALNFLAPQQRVVQGISRSLHLSNPSS